MSHNPPQAKPSPLSTLWRLLTFRATRAELETFDHRHLLLGLLLVWIVGIGRTWDDPQVEPLRRSGVGSLAYVFFLSLLLWLIVKTLARHVTYRHVLTFVCFAAAPGLIYAIPVERWFDASTARLINSWFLAVVAIWRVALLIFYYRRYAALGAYATATSTLLPLATIMGPLTFIRALGEALETMGGIREGPPPTAAQAIADMLGIISIYAFLPLLVAHYVLERRAFSKASAETFGPKGETTFQDVNSV